MPKKEDKERKKLVVEEVEAPVTEEMVSSTELSPAPEITEEAAKTETSEVVETPKEEIEQEIHEEEHHLHDIHTNMPPSASPENPEKKSGNPIWWILIPGIFLLGALLGGIVFYQKGVNTGETQTPTPSPTVEASASPSASPVSKADLTKYPINVQNGSGIPGAAGTVKDLLTSAGFKVSATGNAATYDYTDTIIEAKSDVPAGFLSQLKTTLSASYSVGTNVALKDSSTDEVIVIVGSTKAQ